MLKSLYKTNKMTFFLVLCFLVIATPGCNELGGSSPNFAEPQETVAPTPPPTSFKFGVMGDTQWVFDATDPAGTNQGTVAGSFISQVNQEFIDHGVEFVIQVGDLTNYGIDAGIQARAMYAQSLYDAGIGFYPMRGNHEPWGNIYPPNPGVDNGYSIPAMQANFPQNQGVGPNTGGATNFSSPTNPAFPNMTTELDGISYAFDYDDGDGNSATIVILDPWQTATQNEALFSKWYGPPYNFSVPYPYGYRVSYQQAWISDRLDAATRGTEHAFVLSHQPLIASNHEDSPFGFLDEHIDDQNLFYADLVANDVAFYIGGHDHNHEFAMVESPDGLSEVEQIICAPQCPKFYWPNYSSPEWRGEKDRRTVIATEYDNVGYYIFTVEGPIVTCDYYADSTGGWVAGRSSWPGTSKSLVTPQFNYVLKDTHRFSLNGKSFMVAQGGAYSAVTDTYDGTTVRLAGTNTSTKVEYALGTDGAQNMPLTKKITTAWRDQPNEVDSNVLLLEGLNESGAALADKYVLSMSTASTADIGTRIVTQNNSGAWVDAATRAQTGQRFVAGPASIAYDAGSYGFDAAANTAWVVLDYDGTFAVKQFE